MINVYFFDWEGDCQDEWLDKKEDWSVLRQHAVKVLQSKDGYALIWMVNLDTKKAVRIYKKTVLAEVEEFDQEMIDNLINQGG